jgi:coenzyme F420-reducing hydrogenase delta subunit
MEKSDWEKRRERYSFITAKGTKKDCNYTEEDLEDAKKEAFRQGQIAQLKEDIKLTDDPFKFTWINTEGAQLIKEIVNALQAKLKELEK